MTKLIVAFIVVVVAYCGYQIYVSWEKAKKQEDTGIVEKAATPIRGEQLPGLPFKLETSLVNVQQQGTDTFRKWLKTYADSIQDPRRAWIELDFCVAVTREDPNEAKRVFAEVRARTGPSSPVWPRVKELEKTYK